MSEKELSKDYDDLKDSLANLILCFPGIIHSKMKENSKFSIKTHSFTFTKDYLLETDNNTNPNEFPMEFKNEDDFKDNFLTPFLIYLTTTFGYTIEFKDIYKKNGLFGIYIG